MASGLASYSVSATNYGRNSVDSYYQLSAPGVVNGNLDVTGNLTVAGTTDLTGPVTCANGVAVTGTMSASVVASAGAVTGASAAITGAVTAASVAATGAVTAASMTATGAIAGASAAIVGAASAASLALVGATQAVPAPAGAGSAVTWATALERKGTKLVYSYSAALSNVQNITVPSPYAGNVFSAAGVLTINLQSQGAAGDTNGRIIQVQYAIYNVGTGAFTQSANYVNDVTGGVTGSAPAGYVLTAGGAAYSGSCFVTWETIQP